MITQSIAKLQSELLELHSCYPYTRVGVNEGGSRGIILMIGSLHQVCEDRFLHDGSQRQVREVDLGFRGHVEECCV